MGFRGVAALDDTASIRKRFHYYGVLSSDHSCPVQGTPQRQVWSVLWDVYMVIGPNEYYDRAVIHAIMEGELYHPIRARCKRVSLTNIVNNLL